MHLEPQPLREPIDEALFLGRPDLDRPIDVRGVQRVRERRLPREARRRARRARSARRAANQPRPMPTTSVAASERRQRAGAAGDAARAGAAGRPRRADARVSARPAPRSSASRSAAFCARIAATRAASSGSFAACALDAGAASAGSAAVDIRMDVGFGHGLGMAARSLRQRRSSLDHAQRRTAARRPAGAGCCGRGTAATSPCRRESTGCRRSPRSEAPRRRRAAAPRADRRRAGPSAA